VKLEERAGEISMYAPMVIPSLLQTAEYAGAIMTGGRVAPEHGRARVKTRMQRQALLGVEPRPRVTVVIDESALVRPIGGADVLHRQVLRLIELCDHPGVTIQVLPLAVGAHPAVTGPFTILAFPRSNEPPCVFCDGLTGGSIHDKPDDVALYRSCFEELRRLARPSQDSVSIFTAIANGDAGTIGRGI
jgi:hypothetical protein